MRLLDKIGSQINCGGHECHVGASIGAALYPLHDQNQSDILTAADQAMYQAKRAGKNRVVMAGVAQLSVC